MMKAVGVALLAASPAWSTVYVDGNSLLQQCQDPSGRKFCTGYVLGAVDTFGVVSNDNPEFYVADGDDFIAMAAFCIPLEVVSSGQLTDIVVKYLNEHPEQRHWTAAMLVQGAMIEAFPCD